MARAAFPGAEGEGAGPLRELRGGKLNESRFHARMRGEGVYAAQLRALFHATARKAGIDARQPELSTAAFRRPPTGPQLGLFDA